MSSILPQPRFYVYILARPNGTPFYVGKGQQYRVSNHETEARSGHKCHKCNLIRKIWRNGGEVQRYIVFTTDDEQAALDYEKETIALHGRENLCNQNDGGEGSSNPSEAVREKMRAAWERKRQNPEFWARYRAGIDRREDDPTYRARISESVKKHHASEEYREQERERGKSLWADPEKRERKSKEVTARFADGSEKEQYQEYGRRSWEGETREKTIAGLRIALSTPEYRKARSEIAKNLWKDPEFRAKQIEIIKQRSKDPEYRARIGEKIRQRNATPEYRAKLSAAGKLGAKRRWGKKNEQEEDRES